MQSKFLASILTVGLAFGTAQLLSVNNAVAQEAQPNDQAEFSELKAAKIGKVEKPSEKRKTLAEEEGGTGPKLEFQTDEMYQKAMETEKLQLQASAIKKLRKRIAQTDDDDPSKPELMERLGDMLWQQARYYDLSAFDNLQQARQLNDKGQKQAALKANKAKESDEKSAKASRDEMLKLYKNIIKYFPDYSQIDKIRYYLAFNQAQMGYAADAYENYSSIVREHSNSPYLADAFLGMAEYTFTIEEDMKLALQQYQKVVSIDPTSSAASYAMYKMGWCYMNLGEPKKALAQFEMVIKEADAGKGDARRRTSMRNEAVKDLVKAYSMWDEAKPARARKYFSKFAKDPEDLNKMMERLARLYGEDGKIEESNAVYNQLIAENPKNFKDVDYQREIMMNTETYSDPEKTVAEIKRTVALFTKARDENWKGATPEKVKEEYDILEKYTRDTAQWYHSTYETTKNPLYYSMAYSIYEVYMNNFFDAAQNIEMLYFYADMAYWRGNYAEAAKRFDEVVEKDPKGKYSADAAHGAVKAYEKLIGLKEGTPDCPPVPETPPPAAGQPQTFPELPIAECRIKFIEASKRYAKIDTSAENAINSEYMAAKIYYDYNHFDEAKPLFEDIAYNHPDNKLAIYAANLLLDIYNVQKDYKGMLKTVQKFKTISPLTANSELNTKLDSYEVILDFKLCRQMEEKKQWEDAANCYEDFATKYPNSEHSAMALWNAGHDWQNISEMGKAIDARFRMLTEHGNSDLAPRALYAIAQNYHGIAVFSEAAKYYEMFVKYYPNDKTACVEPEQVSKEPCAMAALSNAAAFRSGLGEYQKAVEDYDLYTRMFPKNQEQIAQLKFNIGRIYYDQGLYQQAIDRYTEFLQKYAKQGYPGLKVQAYTAIGRCEWKMKKFGSALKSFEKTEDLYKGKEIQRWLNAKTTTDSQKNDTMNAAAEARFMRGEAIFKEAMAIQLTDEDVSERHMEKYLQAQLKKKAEKMKEAAPIYEDVIKLFNSPKWGLAALSRLGMMYNDVAKQIEHAPIPKRLTQDQSLIYEDLLLDFASQFEDKAVNYYVVAVKRAADMGWFSEYTQAAQKRLFDLRPQDYRSSSEIKAQPNKAVTTIQTDGLFTDTDELEGKVIKKRRKVNMDKDVITSVPGESAANAQATAGTPDTAAAANAKNSK